jgi:hypothetical protein
MKLAIILECHQRDRHFLSLSKYSLTLAVVRLRVGIISSLLFWLKKIMFQADSSSLDQASSARVRQSVSPRVVE